MTRTEFKNNMEEVRGGIIDSNGVGVCYFLEEFFCLGKEVMQLFGSMFKYNNCYSRSYWLSCEIYEESLANRLLHVDMFEHLCIETRSYKDFNKALKEWA